MKTSPFPKVALLFFLLASVCVPSVNADTPPPSASPEVIEKKIREEATEKLLQQKPPAPLPVQVEKPPQQKGKVRFVLKKINLQPAKTMTPQAVKALGDLKSFAPLLKEYEGREVSFDDLNVLDEKIQNEFRRRGFFALVYTPPQKITDSSVVIEILASQMGELHIEGARYFRKSKTLKRWKIPEGEILRTDKMQASLQAMNENPDRSVKPVLHAGKKPGTTDVTLKTRERFPVHPGFSFDNQGARLTGKQRVGFTVRDNNLLTLDDIFMIGTVFGADFGALFLQHIIPVNDVGTRFLYGFSHSQVLPKKEFKELGINGISQTYTMAVRQRLKRTDRFAAEGFAGFDFKEKWTHTQSVVTGWDRLRVLSLGTDFQAADSHGLWTWTPAVYAGFSPHGNGYALTSRQAHTRFLKTEFKIERQQRLFWGTRGKVRFEAQTSPFKLPAEEQMFLGGAQSVRGYPESDYGADQAVLTNVEYYIPFFIVPPDWKLPGAAQPLRQQIQLVAFVDHGYGQVHGPSASESRARNLLGAGGGVSIQLSKYLFLRVEWAGAAAQDPLTEGGNSQVHFRLQAEV